MDKFEGYPIYKQSSDISPIIFVIGYGIGIFSIILGLAGGLGGIFDIILIVGAAFLPISFIFAVWYKLRSVSCTQGFEKIKGVLTEKVNGIHNYIAYKDCLYETTFVCEYYEKDLRIETRNGLGNALSSIQKLITRKKYILDTTERIAGCEVTFYANPDNLRKYKVSFRDNMSLLKK